MIKRVVLVGRLAAVVALAASLASVPIVLSAQTFEHGVGEQPSRDLSVPPDAAPINRLGAMRKADSPQDQHARTNQTPNDSAAKPTGARQPQ